jgi:hypothetical protein
LNLPEYGLNHLLIYQSFDNVSFINSKGSISYDQIGLDNLDLTQSFQKIYFTFSNKLFTLFMFQIFFNITKHSLFYGFGDNSTY